MTRTAAVRRARAVPWRPASGEGRACEFCATLVKGGKVNHDLCPGKIADAGGAKGSVWQCPCAAAGHPPGGNPSAS
jgi:hypothetical protein